jgi:putative intracellular protease/amidase
VAALRVGVPLYPNFDSLDVCGPYQTFTLAQMECHLIGPSTDGFVTSFEGVSIKPTATFDACPDLDMLFVPGGSNPVQDVILNGPLGNNPYLDFLVKRARTEWICSVCTGALLLGAAGLLHGHTCTTHWVIQGCAAGFPPRKRCGRLPPLRSQRQSDHRRRNFLGSRRILIHYVGDPRTGCGAHVPA